MEREASQGSEEGGVHFEVLFCHREFGHSRRSLEACLFEGLEVLFHRFVNAADWDVHSVPSPDLPFELMIPR